MSCCLVKEKPRVLVHSVENVFYTFRKAILLTWSQVAALLFSIHSTFSSPPRRANFKQRTGDRNEVWARCLEPVLSGGEIILVCLLYLLCLLKLGSYIWPKVESRCWAACKDLQSEGKDLARLPFGSGGHKAWNPIVVPVVTIHQNERFSNSWLKTEHFKHQQHKYKAEILSSNTTACVFFIILSGDNMKSISSSMESNEWHHLADKIISPVPKKMPLK